MLLTPAGSRKSIHVVNGVMAVPQAKVRHLCLFVCFLIPLIDTSLPRSQVTAIKDAEHLTSLLGESKLLVIDCHQSWCGPCETVRPTYNALNTQIDDCDERVVFLTADLTELSGPLGDLFKGTEIDLGTHGCMPFFLVVKDGKVSDTIFGADVPKLRHVVTTDAPPFTKAD